MSNTIIIKNREPQAISIRGGGEVLGITTVYVNGIDVTEGSVAYVIVPTKTSELTNDSGFINHEVDPTVPYYVKQITQADINSWNNKQDELVSGTNIKTINSNSLLGSGNIDISTSYTAGTGINISSENVISNTITSYDDLSDLPTIPTKTSELLNDSGYLVADDLSNVAFSGSYADLSDVPDLSEYATLDTEDLENYYTKRFMWNILPRTTGSGVSVSLSDTLNEAPIELSLAPSELSQDGTPTPSSPQDIHTISGSNKVVVSDGNGNSQEADIDLDDLEYCKIGNYEDKFIRTSGKNLFDGLLEAGTINASGNNERSSDRVRTINYIPVIPGQDYYLSSNFGTIDSSVNSTIYGRCYDKNKTYVSALTISKNGTFTIPDNIYYFRWQYIVGSGNQTTAVNTHFIMLNKGTTALDYEPYSSNEWYIKKNIDKVVLDGTEIWLNDSNFYYYMGIRMLNNTTPFCDYAQYVANKNNIDALNEFKLTRSGNGYPEFSKYTFSTNTDFKTWLASNNVTIYYVPYNPTYTQITGTLETQLENAYYNLTAYDNQTTITQTNNDLPFVISASTPKTMVNM